MIVLCLNDYPVGVYTTEALADEAALSDWRKREPRWKEQGLKLGETMFGTMLPAHKATKYYYHQHEFKVDAAAEL